MPRSGVININICHIFNAAMIRTFRSDQYKYIYAIFLTWPGFEPRTLCSNSNAYQTGRRTPPGSAMSSLYIYIYIIYVIYKSMGLDRSMLIHRWRCDASWALEVTYLCCLHYDALLEVLIIDLLND